MTDASTLEDGYYWFTGTVEETEHGRIMVEKADDQVYLTGDDCFHATSSVVGVFEAVALPKTL